MKKPSNSYEYSIKYDKQDAMYHVKRHPANWQGIVGRCYDKDTANTVLAALLLGADIKGVVYFHNHKNGGRPVLVRRKIK